MPSARLANTQGPAPAAELVVLSTDPLAGLDIPHMVAEDGHRLVRHWREGETSAFHLAKAAT